MMTIAAMIEGKLEAVLKRAAVADAPAGLTNAIKHAVLPGGARVRPRLCLASASACGMDDPELALSAAAAIELLHCASLVHDDLPCFDDATVRRGQPSVHCAFGERLAVLTGDALIVMAFETVALSPMKHPERLGPLVALISRSVGAPYGIAAGQAWECEQKIDMEAYHRAKTGALFVGSAEAGALASGGAPAAWTRFGEYLGLAYQTADDLQDAFGDVTLVGKPVGRDAALSRPSAVAELGAAGAAKRVRTLVHEAVSSIPECKHRPSLIELVFTEMQRFLPHQVQLRVVA
jgi:geranylgeranyl diphosphate synthase, type II